MSSVYATEPVTSGRVILETTDGPLEIHLWCRECPHTTRFFLQLCLDGFYTDMIFHRIVNNFLIQTGALRHSSSSHASVPMTSPEAQAYRDAVKAPTALERRQYEVNSRIRFNHRGQVAMALGIGDDSKDVADLQPQFFITLEDAPYLDGSHVCFGTISGPTIFNALRIGRTEVDEKTHQPVDLADATRIKNVKIVDNPIHEDLVPQSIVPWRVIKKNDDNKKDKKKKKKRKGKFDVNVLSFGDEFAEENTKAAVPKGMQSSHDLVESKVLSKQIDDKVKGAVFTNHEESSTAPENINNSDAADRKKKRRLNQSENYSENDTTNGSGELKPPIAANADDTSSRRQSSSTQQNNEIDAVKYTKKESREKEKADSVSAQEESRSNEKAKLQQQAGDKVETKPPSKPKVSAVEARRLKYTKGKKSKKEREEETLAKLNAFRSTVQQTVEEKKAASTSKGRDQQQQDSSLAARMARRAEQADGSAHPNGSAHEQVPTYHGQVLESDDGEDVDGTVEKDGKSAWLATSFKCRRHIDHDSAPGIGEDGRAADDYEVVDPVKHRDRKNKHRSGKSRQHHGKSKHHKQGNRK